MSAPMEKGRDDWGLYVDLDVRGVGQRMRWIEPGTFMMGSPEYETWRCDWEQEPHSVEISQGFWLADTPCTQALWEAVMGANPSRFQSPDRPVEQVSWDDCQEFCRRLEEHLGGVSFRLPTEAEWEYACRAGTETATYAGPIEIRGLNNAPILDPIAWYGGNSGVGFDLAEGEDSSGWREKQFAHSLAGTRRVKTKLPNAWGLYDTLGNVWEWCESLWEPRGSDRAIRGGSWDSSAGFVRAAHRYLHAPSYRWDFLGFRLCSSDLDSKLPKEITREDSTEPGYVTGIGNSTSTPGEPPISNPSEGS